MSMAKQGTKTAVPRLRFPEFRKSWDSIAVSDFFDLAAKAEKTSFFDGDRLLTVKLHCNGVVKNERSTLTGGANYFTRKAGQFIFSKIDLLNGAFGIVPDALDGFSSSSDVPAYSFNAECSSIFFLNWLKSHYSSLQIERTGTSNTLKRVAPEKFLALAILAPSLAEQQKIADCLTSLDEVIAAQGRKVEALKAHKRGLMQQLFPREGETRPRLRFPEFRNAPNWRETPLGDLVDLLSGYPFDGKDIVEDSSGEPLMRGINITEGAVRHSVEIDRYYLGSVDRLEKFRLRKNDLVIGMDGSKVGKNSALIGDEDVGALLIQRVARLRAESAELMAFIFQQVHSPRFHAYVDRINTSSGIPHISARQIKDYPIHFTSEAEQRRIADCLSSLDAQITAESNQLAALKTHKQGLMQQLFPAPEAVGA